jgi:hypothetical protein
MADSFTVAANYEMHVIRTNDEAFNWLTFSSSGLRINLRTGEVVIPEGLSLDDASRAFWEGLRAAFPGVAQSGPPR